MDVPDYSDEAWRPIPSFGDYAVSSHGRVKRIKGMPHLLTGKPLATFPDVGGYEKVELVVTPGRKRWFSVSRLVARTFLGEPPTPSHHAAHWDGDKSNNNIRNLRWATPKENTDDRRRHGNSFAGAAHMRAKLTVTEATELMERRRHGEPLSRLANHFGVSRVQAGRIARGLTWHFRKP